MKRRVAFYFVSFFLFGFLFVADIVTAQTIAYRRANLASNPSNVANNVTPGLADPWGIAFLPDQPFFLAGNNVGRVTAHDASGLGVRPGSFTVPNAAGAGFDTPTGIVADQNSFFGSASLVKPFILVTDQGTVLTWGLDARGDLPQHATLEVNNAARSAVYKGVAILNSSLTQPALAVTDFHGGFIETFIPGFAPVALPGSFTDPNLPLGFAPFGFQVIGRQVFVTYAVQDAVKHDLVIGAGNGVVSIFDMDGNFIRRFATGGALDAPWGIIQASANFGPCSNDILIGNIGDGIINAFDPTTGRLVGKLTDGDGKDITEVGLHGLAFRLDGFADANTLFFTSEFSSERDGLFGAITTGLVSVVTVSAPEPSFDESTTITARVAAGPGNVGALTGMVTFLDGSTRLGTAGRSTQFMLNVVPSGGFANSVSFSCAPVTGVTCNFNPAVITPSNGTTKTVLTVTSSSSVMHFGFLMPDLIGPWTILAAMALLSLAMWRTRSLPYPRRPQLAAVITAIVMLGLAISGCGGYASRSQVNRGTATINVVAQSGAISHTTTISVTVQ